MKWTNSEKIPPYLQGISARLETSSLRASFANRMVLILFWLKEDHAIQFVSPANAAIFGRLSIEADGSDNVRHFCHLYTFPVSAVQFSLEILFQGSIVAAWG